MKSPKQESKKMKRDILIGLALSPLISALFVGLWYTNKSSVVIWVLFIFSFIWPGFLWGTRLGQILTIALLVGTFMPVLIWIWNH